MLEAYKCQEAETMKRVSEAEAYRAWHKEQYRRAKWERDMRRIRLDIEGLELSIRDSLARQHEEEREKKTRDLVEKMFADRAFNKVLAHYWGHTPKGWLAACGCDGRMKSLLRDPGWDVLQEAIRRIRVAKGLVREDCQCEARVMPDATLALKIKLGYGG
jgi:hypothetical protein